MNLSVGIVGLPNVGKSTLFNALLQRQIALVAEYPFTTIEPHTGVVEVPDERLRALCEIIKPEKCVPAAVKFIDIAGLVQGAAEGEGLGNQFLSHIREVDAILHVVRGFKNEKVVHTTGEIDPKRDSEIINEELRKAGIVKPTVYVVNISEADISQQSAVNELRDKTSVVICAKLEAELSQLSLEEQQAFLQEVGVFKSGLDKVIAAAYQLLDLITFFTIKGGKQVQAWPLKRGLSAIAGAGLVHSDLAQKFIKAEVVTFADFIKFASWFGCKQAGKIRLEGRDYRLTDGDIVEFMIGS